MNRSMTADKTMVHALQTCCRHKDGLGNRQTRLAAPHVAAQLHVWRIQEAGSGARGMEAACAEHKVAVLEHATPLVHHPKKQQNWAAAGSLHDKDSIISREWFQAIERCCSVAAATVCRCFNAMRPACWLDCIGSALAKLTRFGSRRPTLMMAERIQIGIDHNQANGKCREKRAEPTRLYFASRSATAKFSCSFPDSNHFRQNSGYVCTLETSSCRVLLFSCRSKFTE